MRSVYLRLDDPRNWFARAIVYLSEEKICRNRSLRAGTVEVGRTETSTFSKQNKSDVGKSKAAS